ncbi:hypothetical protein [Butyrivibrio sp. VCB2006]|uniref:hypothetical protein n=1 Tax=Butyrivibrio sp. VCB2006 TaxID=1280679 RepID=UPI000413BDE2|nr:hypothetical protein [Butyrivibrio sp. VCB2006]
MVKKNLLRSISVIMACMMAVMTVACGSNSASTESASAVVETAQEQQLENTLMTRASNAMSSEEAGKVETVYVTANASGAVNNVIVSEWLKNANASTELSDTSELKDIVNVKGSETFTENGDGTLTWDAEGSDIYYQGTTDKELPVDMKITYTLDGKEIEPEELAGKSGRVTIRFEYDNKAKQTVDVDGKDIEVYTPFAMVSGMMLDADKFSNVEISNGKIISDGGNYIVMGVALPGLKESLNISDDKWDELEDSEEIQEKLSNAFEITADTTDFELGMTITMASSDILSDFGAADLTDSDKIDELKDDMNELNDGSNKLVDGAGELKDGTGKLYDGTTELYDGTSQLYDGTKDLKDGTGRLVDGTGKLADGAGKLVDGAGQLADGVNTLKDGTGKLYDGTGSLYDGVVAYTDGVSKVNDGAAQLAQGTGKLKDGSKDAVTGVETLKGGADKLTEGSKTLYSGLADAGLKISGASKVLAMKGTLVNEYAQYSAAYMYLTDQGGTYEACADLLKTLSNGEIANKETAEQMKAIGLPYVTVTAPVMVVSQQDNGDENETTVTGGTIDAPESEDAAGSGSTEQDTQQPEENGGDPAGDGHQEEETSPENKPADNQENPENRESENNDQASEDSSKSEENQEIAKGSEGNGESEGSKESSGSSETTVTEEQLAAFLGTEQGKVAAVKCVLGDQALLGQILADPSVQSALLNNEELMGQMLSNPAVLAKITGNSDILAKLLGDEKVLDMITSNEAVMTKLMSDEKVLNKIMSNEAILAKLMSDEKVVGMITSNKALMSKILSDKNLMNSLIQDPEVIKMILGDKELLSNVLSNEQSMALLLSNKEAMALIMANEEVKAMVMNSDDMKLYSKGLAAYAQLVGVTGAVNTTLGNLLVQLNNLQLDENSINQFAAAVEGAKQLSEGNAALSAGLDQLLVGTKKLSAGIGQLDEGAASLANGTKTLNANSGALRDGASQLKSGAGQLNDGAGQLKDGADKLKDGTVTLKDGTDELNSGAAELNDGAGKLMDGAKELYDGAGELNDGAKKLDDGVQELLDGICKFDEEGIKKIYEAFDGDLTEFADKMTAIQEAGASYTSFGGANADEKCSVKFIIKTEGVKAENI